MSNRAILKKMLTVWRRAAYSVALGLFIAAATLMSVWLLPAPALAGPLQSGGSRATLTVTNIIRQGGVAETTYTADGDGHKFNNNGETWVRVQNDYTATITATFVTPGTVDGLAVADLDVPVSAGATRLIGNFPPGRFNQDDGTVYLNWNSAVTGSVAASVTVGAFRIQQ